MTTRNKATDFKAKYTALIADVRTLKLDLESMAHQSSDRDGLQVEITDVLGTYTNPEVKIEYSDGEVRQEFTVVFLGKSADSNVEIDHESISYAWVPFSELMSTGMADSQRRRISDLLHFFSTGEKQIS